ncbi:MAG: M48 family peptidase [Zetaproteobacteria bacterium CG12_big_fil_rev_8_21_14_0_65_55_1124]|nr:MAG: M48 family peptidase [Zetaproteobacteria bacterium CG08_land_8_20_14_0_20_55_17]PIW42972.1 MAG: M48 family peptidase [Zetaproteobacteria bacterium CG12_big_fil_rev_8_21_14_0_65_55_1124]PIY54275.1 MAG: M48 family peptidase [Zetaproteobacteria bacterium CG_4_10_14_0_8_um_filter_55_43]PIZ40315.1 MAG: M48 family peptidase [Zetaproteobacteria bacterium CG_4_10_14_0_2_um_filter_55_20]PJB82874.1 MAG: M48 family peptidase [Zetaproteobacteria bacterium CG_4_9_14_0_8_um_filter_55_31]
MSWPGVWRGAGRVFSHEMRVTHYIDTPEGGFSYVIERRPRRRTVGIQVCPDGKVLVAAHPLVPHLYVKRLLRAKAAWVNRKLADAVLLHHHKASRSYAQGDVITYLGREYNLNFATRSRLDEAGGELHLGMRGKPERDAVIAALTRWYKQQARLVLTERADLLTKKFGQQPTLIGIKSYRSRWGSCHSDGRIYFNWRLVMAPQNVIDYVVVHELCHLMHHNHSRDFWDQVAKLFPDYKEQRRWLRRQGPFLDL